jgi:Carboxypeptidase regulatory-like domain
MPRTATLVLIATLLGAAPVRAGQETPASATQSSAPSNNQDGASAPRPTATISGRIVDPTGVAIVGAAIKLSGIDPGSTQQAVSDSDGRFAFVGAAAGPVHLAIAAAGFAPQELSANANPGENLAVPQITLLVATLVTEVKVTPPTFEIAQAEIKEQEKQRALGFIPNYYVTYVPNAAPLAPRQKFELAWKTMVDPVTFGITGAIAGIQQAQNEFSGYGQGADGYAKRYGAAYADSAIGTLIGGAILPSLLKQDPRYFYKGTGSTKSRLWYAMSRAVVCKGDNGRWQPNYSGLIGGLAAGGISNLYYPAKDRDQNVTFENFFIGIGASAAANVLQEFVVKRLTPSLSHRDPNGTTGKPPNAISRAFGLLIHEGD